MLNKPTDFVSSFAKGLRVLEAFDTDHPRLNITEVSNRTGLDRATARRCLLTLSEIGYADYDGKYFGLTPRVLRLGLSALASIPITKIVQPWLDKLSEQIQQSCSVAILEGVEIVYIARAAHKRIMSIGLLPGSRLPAYCTSMGRVLLASLSDEEVLSILDKTNLVPRTPKGIADTNNLLTEIQTVRKQGYSFIDQEVEPGLRSISVPLINSHGLTIAALNTGFAGIDTDPQSDLLTYLPKLLEVQTALKTVLT